MCDTRGHDHWCSSCGKNLNKEPKDSYIEIEWSQDDKGRIVEEKSMICKECLEKSDNIKELNEFFLNLQYPPWSHVFCSSCKKDLTEEYKEKAKGKVEEKGLIKKIKGKIVEKFEDLPRPGVDYECLNFKCHERSGPNIKHIMKVVVLCRDCVKSEFNAENLEKLKKLGKNPKFAPLIVCDKIDICKQYRPADKNVNCKNIVIGRDRETLQFGLLCGRRHKGCQLLPFDDGVSIIRPRKGKGAAAASFPTIATAPGVNPISDYMKEIERILKKYKLGKFDGPSVDYTDLKMRVENIEKALNMNNRLACAIVGPEPAKIEQVDEQVDSVPGPVPILAPTPTGPIVIEATHIMEGSQKKKNGKRKNQTDEIQGKNHIDEIQ